MKGIHVDLTDFFILSDVTAFLGIGLLIIFPCVNVAIIFMPLEGSVYLRFKCCDLHYQQQTE